MSTQIWAAVPSYWRLHYRDVCQGWKTPLPGLLLKAPRRHGVTKRRWVSGRILRNSQAGGNFPNLLFMGSRSDGRDLENQRKTF